MLIRDGVNLNIFKTDKFKTVTIDVILVDNSLENEEIKRNLLSLILNESCKNFRTKKEVNDALSVYYDADISFEVGLIGCARVLEAKVDFIDGKYVNDDDLLKNEFNFLHDFLFEPIFLFEDYDENLFNELKYKLKQNLKIKYDNPYNYAKNKALSLLDENIIMLKESDIDLIDEICIEDIKDLYSRIINNCYVDIVVVGDVDKDIISEYVNTYFPFSNRSVQLEIINTLQIDNSKEKYDTKQIDQSILEVLYTTDLKSNDENHYASLIGNGILGIFPTSLLFSNIREKKSLCYTISSGIDNYYGFLHIATGIDSKNIDEVIKLIDIEVSNVKNGNFSDELLETTKNLYVSAIKSNNDTDKGIILQQLKNDLLKIDTSVEEIIEKLNEVKKEDVIKAFKNVDRKCIYALKQMESK